MKLKELTKKIRTNTQEIHHECWREWQPLDKISKNLAGVVKGVVIATDTCGAHYRIRKKPK